MKLKKLSVLGMALCIAVCMPISASAKVTNASAHSNYTKKMKEIISKNKGVSEVKYCYRDLTKDNIHELLAVYDDTKGSNDCIKILSHNTKGKVTTALTVKIYGFEQLDYYKKSNSFTISSCGHGGEVVRYYKLNKGTFKYMATKQRQSKKGGASKNGAWKYSKNFNKQTKNLASGTKSTIKYKSLKTYKNKK